MAVTSSSSSKIVNCLFFESQAEDAANFYTSIFPNSSIGDVARFPGDGSDVHKRPANSAMAVVFKLNGHPFTALNSRPAEVQFTEAVSFQIMCDNQDEVDHYWDKLSEGGDETKQMCGWLKDKYGLSWQVVPKDITKIMTEAEPDKRRRAMQAFMKMRKIIIQDVIDAVEGKGEKEEA
jgi:predicted 3-demethylubiquinone-9 3-methyltransferase (glyoxalase superfamily)